MRHLFEVDAGATYWVVAEDEMSAKAQVIQCEHRNLCAEELSEIWDAGVRRVDQPEASGVTYRLGGEEESCSMWFAYMIVRDYPSSVLACSEWP